MRQVRRRGARGQGDGQEQCVCTGEVQQAHGGAMGSLWVRWIKSIFILNEGKIYSTNPNHRGQCQQ